MRAGQIFAAILVAVGIFLLGYYLGKNSIEVGEPEITTEVNVTISSGVIALDPVAITLKDGSIITDTVTIYQLGTLPEAQDTLAVYNDYYLKREYQRTYGTDSTYTLNVTSFVQHNRIIREEYSDIFREKTTIERIPYIKTPTKFGVSLEAPFGLEYIEAKAHILFKQKLDVSIGYNTQYKAVLGVGYYFR